MDKKNKRKNAAAIVIVNLLSGAAVGLIMALYLTRNDLSSGQTLYALLWLIIGSFINIVIHEGGHLVMGRLTGYEFLSFRVGSFAVVCQGGRLRLKRFRVLGTGGQCLMIPPESDSPENQPFLLYHMGGGLFNLIFAALFLTAGLLSDSCWLKAPFIILGGFGIYTGVLNLIPMHIPIPNDGMNILNMKRFPAERVVFYRQLRLNGLLYKGCKMSEIPAVLFDAPQGETSPESADIPAILKGSLLMDTKDFTGAAKLFKSVIDNERTNQLYLNESQCEYLFCRMMNSAPAEEIEELYTKELRSYVHQTEKTYISRKKLIYVYELVYNKDTAAAGKAFREAVEMKESYPSEGEYRSEMGLLEYAKEHFEVSASA